MIWMEQATLSLTPEGIERSFINTQESLTRSLLSSEREWCSGDKDVGMIRGITLKNFPLLDEEFIFMSLDRIQYA